MLKKILVALAVLVLCVGPATALVGVGVLMNPAANASCGPGSSLTVGPIRPKGNWNRTFPLSGSSDTTLRRVTKITWRTPSTVTATGDE